MLSEVGKQDINEANKHAALDARDIEHCVREAACDFVMEVEQRATPPRVVALRLLCEITKLFVELLSDSQ